MSRLRRLYKSSPRLRRLARRLKNDSIGAAATLVLWAIGKLSLERALALGDRLGNLAFRVLRGPRALALRHLELAFGEQLSPMARERVARASFANAARCFCELAKIDEIRARRADYFETEGWEHLERILGPGRGCVAISGHIGNWELLGAYMCWRGHPLAAVARRIYAEKLNDMLVAYRARQGVETILRESPTATRQILRALKSNSILAMLIDQDTHVSSISVPFFGRQARTPVGAASLAIRRNLPVMMLLMQRRDDFGWRVIVKPPFEVVRSGDLKADVRQLTEQFNQALESQIRQSPADWVWWHRRWRRGPVAKLDVDEQNPYSPAVSNPNRSIDEVNDDEPRS